MTEVAYLQSEIESLYMVYCFVARKTTNLRLLATVLQWLKIRLSLM